MKIVLAMREVWTVSRVAGRTVIPTHDGLGLPVVTIRPLALVSRGAGSPAGQDHESRRSLRQAPGRGRIV